MKIIEIEISWGFRAECPFCGVPAQEFKFEPRCPHYRGQRRGEDGGVIYIFELPDPEPEPAPEPKQGPEVG